MHCKDIYMDMETVAVVAKQKIIIAKMKKICKHFCEMLNAEILFVGKK